MSEYIFKIDSAAGLNEKTSEFVLSANFVGEIIRCKECEFWNPEKKSGLKGWCYCDVYKGYKESNGFCDCGERREESE